MQRASKLAVALAAVGLVASACSTTSTATGSLTVGILSPFTGDLSDFGPAMARAVELAADVFEEAASGQGLSIEIDTSSEDTQTSPEPGVEAARKLVETDGAKLIVGPMASGVTIPVSESVTIPEKVLTITPSATSGAITTLDDDGLINRTPPSDEFQAPILADLVVRSLGENATVALGARNDAYGVFIINGVEDAGLNGVRQELNERGVKTLDPVFWDPNATSFESEAQALVADNPDGWVLVDFPATWQKMSAALVRTDKWDPAKTFSADGLKTSKLPQDPPTGSGTEATEGMQGTAPGGVGSEAFLNLWNDNVSDLVPETFSPQAFDATMLGLLAMLAAAVDEAGSSDADAVSEAFGEVTSKAGADQLRDVSRGGTAYSWEQLGDAIAAVLAGENINYEGVSGPVDLDADGNVESVGSNYDIYVFREGELVVTDVAQAAAL